MRLLGLDLGTRRIGLAVSDAAGRIAFPAGWLLRRGKRRDLAALRALVEERAIEAIVVGLPMHMNGRRGPEALAAERFARELETTTGRPVELLDERWTTREAERALREADGAGTRRREPGRLDAAAATLLLQTHLERSRRAAPGTEHP